MLKSFLNQTEKKVVIIVDEYDTPIIHTYKTSNLLVESEILSAHSILS